MSTRSETPRAPRGLAQGAVAFAAAMLLAGAASAATVTFTSITGTWTQATKVDGNDANGIGTSKISWGTPISAGAPLSSYIFTPTPTPASPIAEDTGFSLGTFTHENFPVYPPSLDFATLTLQIAGTIDGNSFSFSPSYAFDHHETPNVGECPYSGATACPDRVSLVGEPIYPEGSSQTFRVGNTLYTVLIDGFLREGAAFVDFITEENEANNASILQARFVTAPIPLPAAAWLMIAGIGGLGLIARRRKAAA